MAVSKIVKLCLTKVAILFTCAAFPGGPQKWRKALLRRVGARSGD